MRKLPYAGTLAAALSALGLLAACHDGTELEDTDRIAAEAAPVEEAGEGKEGAPAMQDLLGTLETDADYSTVVSAISASGLAKGLSADGSVTLFAPSNAAFEKLPASKLEQLMQFSEKGELRRVLSTHIVTERLDAAAIEKAIKAGDGVAEFRTIGRGMVRARMKGDAIQLTAPGGNMARIEKADMEATNGIVHGIDAVLMPPEEDQGDGEAAEGKNKTPKTS